MFYTRYFLIEVKWDGGSTKGVSVNAMVKEYIKRSVSLKQLFLYPLHQ